MCAGLRKCAHEDTLCFRSDPGTLCRPLPLLFTLKCGHAKLCTPRPEEWLLVEDVNGTWAWRPGIHVYWYKVLCCAEWNQAKKPRRWPQAESLFAFLPQSNKYGRQATHRHGPVDQQPGHSEWVSDCGKLFRAATQELSSPAQTCCSFSVHCLGKDTVPSRVSFRMLHTARMEPQTITVPLELHSAVSICRAGPSWSHRHKPNTAQRGWPGGRAGLWFRENTWKSLFRPRACPSPTG